MLDERAALEGLVGERFDRDGLATTTTLVGGDDNARLAVVDTVAEGLGGKPSKDDGVDSTDTGAGHEGSDSLPGHGEVNVIV